jgi:hypothetical protein
VWFLVAGNVLNMAFDGTIIITRFARWCRKYRAARLAADSEVT